MTFLKSAGKKRIAPLNVSQSHNFTFIQMILYAVKIGGMTMLHAVCYVLCKACAYATKKRNCKLVYRMSSSIGWLSGCVPQQITCRPITVPQFNMHFWSFTRQTLFLLTALYAIAFIRFNLVCVFVCVCVRTRKSFSKSENDRMQNQLKHTILVSVVETIEPSVDKTSISWHTFK